MIISHQKMVPKQIAYLIIIIYLYIYFKWTPSNIKQNLRAINDCLLILLLYIFSD